MDWYGLPVRPAHPPSPQPTESKLCGTSVTSAAKILGRSSYATIVSPSVGSPARKRMSTFEKKKPNKTPRDHAEIAQMFSVDLSRRPGDQEHWTVTRSSWRLTPPHA